MKSSISLIDYCTDLCYYISMENVQNFEQNTQNNLSRRLLAAVVGSALLISASCSATESDKPRVQAVAAINEIDGTTSTLSSVDIAENYLQGDGDFTNDAESAIAAKEFADKSDWEYSDDLLSRIDDSELLARTRYSIDKTEARWAKKYAKELLNDESETLQARIDDKILADKTRKAIDKIEANWAASFAESLLWKDSDEMQSRIADKGIAEKSRKTVDEIEKSWAESYESRHKFGEANAMRARIGR